MLTVEGLHTYYGPVMALEDVSLDVAPGSITAVLGANGAGKSSLLRTISGLVRARGGSVRFDGRDITRLAPEEIVRLGLAHAPEGGGVIGELTVDENLELGALWRRDRGECDKTREEVFALMPRLRERGALAADSLSGGERQMLSIGRALMGRPRMLLLDEPSLGLAPIIAAELMRLIRELRADRGLTVLLVEQNARSALSVADRGVVLNVGRVVASGEASALADDEDLRHHYLGL
ncbi:MAG: branched-chain amino acid transporter ATPase [Solirubrobacteraceae bacterium]|nr:branched-chain amino acid transporter ATPase [Solirubrobacteraceae bacterium]